MALATTLVSCAGLKKFPADNIYEVDIANKACGEYKIVDYERLLFEHVRDLPLSACEGVFGFSSKQIAPVMNWSRDAIIFVKQNCKK